jgi:hypothetical protein
MGGHGTTIAAFPQPNKHTQLGSKQNKDILSVTVREKDDLSGPSAMPMHEANASGYLYALSSIPCEDLGFLTFPLPYFFLTAVSMLLFSFR